MIGEGALLVVDPASPYPEEQARLSRYLGALRAEGHEVAALLLTHHHFDHVAGARALYEELGVPVWAHAATLERVPMLRSLPAPSACAIAEGERLPFGPAGLGALHTPGHAPGHLCLRDGTDGAIVAGDMVASVGTIVVDPDDDGDMRVYLGSLARLQGLQPSRLWPAHGAMVAEAAPLIDFYIAHRLMREGKVVAALRQGGGPLEALVGRAYDDVPAAIDPLAARSLLAHLRKLLDEGRAAADESGCWSLLG